MPQRWTDLPAGASASHRVPAVLVPPSSPYFVAHVARHAPCIAGFDDSRSTGAPLFMMYGGKDQLIGPPRCGQVADDLRRDGGALTIMVFPNAVHRWTASWSRA